MTRSRTGALLAAGLSLVLGLGACSLSEPDEPGEAAPDATGTQSSSPAPSSTPEPSASEPPDQPGGSSGRLASFYDQQPEWTPCDGGFECATVQVPVDYADPAGPTVGLVVNRRPADGADPIGALIVNPGGPGASGVSYAPQAVAQFSASVLQSYDIVGFDPRGVAASEPVECVNDAGVDALLAADPDPDTTAEIEDTEALLEDFATGCADDAGPLLPHLSTVDVARDLDVIRAVLGDDELQYYGASYGTFIGAVYAELFPDRVGRAVLDGAVNPALDLTAVNKQQAAGFETALRAYVAACVVKPTCPLGNRLEAGVVRVQRFFDQLDAQPLATGTERELTEALALYGIALPLYAPTYWPLLDQALTQAFDGDGSTLLALADAYWQRTDSGYTGNGAQVIFAVNCLDDPSDVAVAEIKDTIPAFEQAAPTFGRAFAWSPLACAQWPVQPASPVPDVDGAGAAPILVVGTTRDPATPYRWAKAMAAQLDSGVLLTRNGDGHTAYGMGNVCLDSAVDAYLVDGKAPAPGTRC